MNYHLAEVNIARMRAPLDSTIMSEFVAQLDTINTLAEQSRGFVWRLKTDSGDATSIRPFDDDYIIVNLSVWQSLEALHQYVYYSDHTAAYRRRADWFEKMDKPALVMWWVPVGQHPTVEEAKAKLEYLDQHGPTPLAFTFKQRFTVEEMDRISI